MPCGFRTGGAIFATSQISVPAGEDSLYRALVRPPLHLIRLLRSSGDTLEVNNVGLKILCIVPVDNEKLDKILVSWRSRLSNNRGMNESQDTRT